MRENARPHPVGTRGGGEWMRGPCACPGWGATGLLHEIPTGSRYQQDKHKAPTLPHISPCPYRTPFGRQISCREPTNKREVWEPTCAILLELKTCLGRAGT